jgi:hypothetical protein
VNLKSPEEEIDEFLASKPSWLRKLLQFDFSISSDEWLAWHKSDEWWRDAGASVNCKYENLVKRSSSRWSEHCRRSKENALKDVPSVRQGRPRKDALADAAMLLRRAGKSPEEIAVLLRDKFTEMTEKGFREPTPDGIRKLLDSRKPPAGPKQS